MKNPVKKILCTVMALLVVGTSGVVFTGCGSDSEEYTTITWATSGIGSLAPKPKSTKGKISIDSEDSYQATISEVSVDDFKSYVNDCKKKGFDVDYTSVDGMYTAKDKKGYDLSVYYQDDEETMLLNKKQLQRKQQRVLRKSQVKSQLLHLTMYHRNLRKLWIHMKISSTTTLTL